MRGASIQLVFGNTARHNARRLLAPPTVAHLRKITNDPLTTHHCRTPHPAPPSNRFVEPGQPLVEHMAVEEPQRGAHAVAERGDGNGRSGSETVGRGCIRGHAGLWLGLGIGGEEPLPRARGRRRRWQPFPQCMERGPGFDSPGAPRPTPGLRPGGPFPTMLAPTTAPARARTACPTPLVRSRT